jgi:hypothetical protein
MANNGYKNQHIMAENKMEKCHMHKYKCEMCGFQGKRMSDLIIHHKDRSKTNHAISNLLLVCSKCHGKLHSDQLGRPQKKYGKFTVKQVMKLCNVPYSLAYRALTVDAKSVRLGERTRIILRVLNERSQDESKILRQYRTGLGW